MQYFAWLPVRLGGVGSKSKMIEPTDGSRSLNDLRFVEYDHTRDFSVIETTWRSLLETCDHDYFSSWGWVSTWLKSLPLEVDMRLVVGYLQDRPLLAFFLGLVRRWKYGILPTRTIALNATGVRYIDQLYIEYNSVLHDRTLRFDMTSLLERLENISWHEFVFPGISTSFAHQAGLLNERRIRRDGILLDEASTAYSVDLQKVRAGNMDYLQLLSANKRSQIRRSIKEYQKDGEIQLESAMNVPQALEMFDALVRLHQQEWERRGKPGVFSNRYLLEFHRDLITSRFDFGEIQLLKIFTPGAPIGYLYNFVYNHKILFYQSGFNYQPGNLYRPGLVSHFYAILHNARNDMMVYDFMAGEAAYKSSLATDTTPMYWMRLVKSGWRLSVENGILHLKHRLRSAPALADGLKRIRDRFSAAPRSDSV